MHKLSKLTGPGTVAAAALVAALTTACTIVGTPASLTEETPAQAGASAQTASSVEAPTEQAGARPWERAKLGEMAQAHVVTAPATRGSIDQSPTFPGTVRPLQATNLAPIGLGSPGARSASRIEKIYVEVGDQVKAGQLLVQLDHQSLDMAVTQVEANLKVAQARLNAAQQGARPEEVARAQAELSAARARLAGVQTARPEDVTAAQAMLDGARANLQRLQQGPKQADVDATEQAVVQARASVQRAQADLAKLQQGASPEAIRGAQLEVDQAKNSLWAAQSSRDATCGQDPGPSCGTAKARVAAAEAAAQQAQTKLDVVRKPADPRDVTTAQLTLASAQAALQTAETRRDQLNAGPGEEDLRIARAAVVQARENLAKAQRPATASEVEAQRQQVVQAEQVLSMSQNPRPGSDLDLATTQLAQAEIQLKAAQLAAAEAGLLAPFDGVVVARPLAVGAVVDAQTPAITVASRDVEVVADVDQARVGQLRVGQVAGISVSGSPGKTFPGKVASIPPTADVRTHKLAVTVRLDGQVPELRGGTAVRVRITTNARNDAVLVPKDAVVDRGGKMVVFVVDGDRARQVDVTDGLWGTDSVEVPSGIQVGDPVIVAGHASVDDGARVLPAAGVGAGGG